jgi:hypothetical protein
MSEITPDDLRALCNKVKGRGAPATAIHVRDIVKQIFGFAVLQGEIKCLILRMRLLRLPSRPSRSETGRLIAQRDQDCIQADRAGRDHADNPPRFETHSAYDGPQERASRSDVE